MNYFQHARSYNKNFIADLDTINDIITHSVKNLVKYKLRDESGFDRFMEECNIRSMNIEDLWIIISDSLFFESHHKSHLFDYYVHWIIGMMRDYYGGDLLEILEYKIHRMNGEFKPYDTLPFFIS